MRRNTGFTLMEMSIILVVLALFAALVVPNVVAIKRSRDLAALEADVARLPVTGRNEARSARVPVALRVDDTDLVLERRPPDADPQVVKRVPLTGDLRIESARNANGLTDVATWTWTVYPDGSADAGGLEFSEGQNRKSLTLETDGGSRWMSGDLPDDLDEKWPAGELEKRG
jgi:type II secretory pathway pseudopilin PulG